VREIRGEDEDEGDDEDEGEGEGEDEGEYATPFASRLFMVRSIDPLSDR
jgi:hypothetical protein